MNIIVGEKELRRWLWMVWALGFACGAIVTGFVIWRWPW